MATPVPPVSRLKSSLHQSSSSARAYFEAGTKKITKATYAQKGGLGDKKGGAVYVYFDSDDRALYVGETGGGVKERTHIATSKHTDKEWWKKWQYVRYFPTTNRTDRLVLELLLILAYEPLYNVKPGQRSIDELFS